MKLVSLAARANPRGQGHRNTPTDLNVFLAYESLGAALRASESLAVLTRRDIDGLTLKLSPWSFASLADPELRTLSMRSIDCANLVVITSCSRALMLPPLIETWLRSCLERRHKASLAVAALFYDGDSPDEPVSPRLRSLQQVVQHAGYAFFAPRVTEYDRSRASCHDARS